MTPHVTIQEMLRAQAVAIVTVLLSHGAFGQSAATPPAFEVASIKPAPPQAPGRVSIRLSTDPARLAYTNVSLSDVIAQAYRVQRNQISGPAWLDTERFDIFAKIPAAKITPNSTEDQIPQMLQALLADRFKLRLHSEKRELPLYLLAVGKNGTKLQKAESSRGVGGGFNPGRGHVSGTLSMARLADYLSVTLGRPVRNMTEMDGAYAIALDWVPDPAEEPAPVAASQPGATDGGTLAASGPSIFTALQEQLGLKLVARKGPVEVLVIDRAEKIPTEN